MLKGTLMSTLFYEFSTKKISARQHRYLVQVFIAILPETIENKGHRLQTNDYYNNFANRTSLKTDEMGGVYI